MPFLSIIIPVYKVEKYLNRCVDSVINQNLDDIEIILVDDGSPDNSPVLCDEYAQKYNYIKVLHKENGGASSARNVGIKAAMGEYLMFVDSDDWWNSNVDVNKMLDYVKVNKNTQMFLFTSFDYDEKKGYLKRKEHENFATIPTGSVKEYYQRLLSNGNLEVHASTKIIKTDFIKSNNLYFKEGSTGEDNEWMMRILRVLESVDIINEPLYIYCADRDDSVTHTIKEKNIVDMLSIVNDSLEFYDKDTEKRFMNEELCFASYLWFSSLGLSNLVEKNGRKNLKSLFKKTERVCKYSNSRKTKLCNTVYKIFGYNITVWVLGRYIKFKQKHNVTRKPVDDITAD